jgi:hypothetical protein
MMIELETIAAQVRRHGTASKLLTDTQRIPKKTNDSVCESQRIAGLLVYCSPLLLLLRLSRLASVWLTVPLGWRSQCMVPTATRNDTITPHRSRTTPHLRTTPLRTSVYGCRTRACNRIAHDGGSSRHSSHDFPSRLSVRSSAPLGRVIRRSGYCQHTPDHVYRGGGLLTTSLACRRLDRSHLTSLRAALLCRCPGRDAPPLALSARG